MLQRLASLAHSCHQQQQLQVLLPLLVQQQQHLHQQLLQQQESLLAAPRQPFRSICTSCSSSSRSSSSTSIRSSSSSASSVLSRHGTFACSSWSWVPNPLWGAQLASYSQRLTKLNPKERKAQQVKDKKALKKSAVPQGTASAADSTTSFEDEMQTVEADVTRLVLQAIHNITPVLDVRTIRSATTVKYVPGLMPPKKARSLALHWLVRAADNRKKSSRASYAECLALELLLAYQKRGGARQKRDDLHKLALQNRANVHLRWW